MLSLDENGFADILVGNFDAAFIQAADGELASIFNRLFAFEPIR